LDYVEYGKENSDVIILLHGGGLSWWNYKEVAERLQTDYHVILPILDGHAGCDKQFTTIENNALDIIEFVNSKLGGSVLMMGGLSLGGQILLEILSQRKDICKYAIVESVLVIPSKFTYSMIKPAFGSCYGLIKYKWVSKLQFKSLRIKSNLFDEYYKDKSLYFNNYCKIISCLRKYFNFKDKKFFILQCFIFYIVIIQNITYNIQA
jgi:pimeloyl-ACP methyl ester carboxylesterase